jgi:pimeloyl-ACP methyl ester carboxylesterase
MAEVDEVVTTASGRRVGVLQRGPADGRVVVYLHGMPGGRGEQRLFPDDVLADVGVRLISVDRPGWGRTDRLAGDRPTRVRDALEVADVLGIDRFAAMGLSTGGTYALTLAAIAPERVERLVLACAQMPYDDEGAIATLLPDQVALVPVLRGGRSALLEQGVAAYRDAVVRDPVGALEPSLGSFSAEERGLLDTPWFRDALVAEMRDAFEPGIEGAVDDLLAWPVPLEVDVAQIRCPVLAVHGTEDDWEPIANLQRILAGIPQAQLVAVEGRSHLAPELEARRTLSLAVEP